MLNKVGLIGHVGGEVTARSLSGNRKTANLSLATHRRWNDKDGNRREDTQWHRVVFWGKQAELADRLLKKGQLVYLEERLNHASWTDYEERTHYRTEVVGHTFLILSPRSSGDPADSPSEESDG